MRIRAIGRYWSWPKSCSRGQVSFTGALTALAICTAWETKSFSNLRPRPPPSSVVCTVTLLGSIPQTAAAVCAARPGACVGAQISQWPGVTLAVQASGSIAACARYGTS